MTSLHVAIFLAVVVVAGAAGLLHRGRQSDVAWAGFAVAIALAWLPVWLPPLLAALR